MPVYLNQDDALALWRDALSASVRGDGPALSARQMAMLTSLPPAGLPSPSTTMTSGTQESFLKS